MKYFLRVDSGREYELTLEDCGEERCLVRLGGQTMHADFLEVDRFGQYAVILDGRSFAVSIEEENPQHLGVNIAGESFMVEVFDQREKIAQEVAGQGGPKAETVKASMPGALIAVKVVVGDLLDPGAPVAVLEAMKMQNEVACQHGGVVVDVAVVAGQTVDAGQILVRLEPVSVAATESGD